MAVDKKDNFERIAMARLDKITKAISSLENLSNKSYYEYTPEQIDRLFDAIQQELNDTREKFNKTEKKKRVRL